MVQILEKQLTLDLHIEHPKSVPGASPEEGLQGEEPIPTEVLGLHGGGLAIQRSSSIWVRDRKDFRIQMRVRDRYCLHADYELQRRADKKTLHALALTKASSLSARVPDEMLSRRPSSVSSLMSRELLVRRHVNPSPTAWTSKRRLLCLATIDS